MLGHGLMDNDKTYPLQTLKDNVKLLTPEILDKKDVLIAYFEQIDNFLKRKEVL